MAWDHPHNSRAYHFSDSQGDEPWGLPTTRPPPQGGTCFVKLGVRLDLFSLNNTTDTPNWNSFINLGTKLNENLKSVNFEPSYVIFPFFFWTKSRIQYNTIKKKIPTIWSTKLGDSIKKRVTKVRSPLQTLLPNSSRARARSNSRKRSSVFHRRNSCKLNTLCFVRH